MSSTRKIFRVTGHLCKEFTGHRYIPCTNGNTAELWNLFFMCAWINSWVNIGHAGYLRRHRIHYDVIVMTIATSKSISHVLGHPNDEMNFALKTATFHYSDVTMGVIASQVTSLTIIYSTVYSDADQRKNQSSASLAFVQGIHRRPVNSPHKWPVTRKLFPLNHVII